MGENGPGSLVMFRGATKVTLDAKGRMAIPSRYRERLLTVAAGRDIYGDAWSANSMNAQRYGTQDVEYTKYPSAALSNWLWRQGSVGMPGVNDIASSWWINFGTYAAELHGQQLFYLVFLLPTHHSGLVGAVQQVWIRLAAHHVALLDQHSM